MARRRSFAAKLMMLAAVTSGLAIVASATTFRTLEWLEVAPSAEREARTLARIIAAAIPATLSFDQPEETQTALAPFSRNPNVLAALVYKGGNLFAEYRREGSVADVPRQIPSLELRVEEQRLSLTEPVEFGGERLGTLLLVYNMQPMYRKVIRNIFLAVIVGGLSMLASLALAVQLQRVLARPVNELAGVAGRVSATKDYGLRAQRYTNDELGDLTDTFNEMLSRIQERESELREAQEALGHSEERFRKIVDTALDAVVTINVNGIITGWNSQAEKVFGWLATEAIGHSMAELIIPPQYREAHYKGLAHYLATGEGPVLNKRIEISALRRGGQEFPIELAITPIRIEQTIQFSAFIQDITPRKRDEQELRDREARFRAVVDTAVDGIVTINERGIIEFVNPAVLTTFGYALEELIGKNVKLLMPEPDSSRHDGYVDHYLRTGEAKIIGIGRDVVAMRKDGTLFPIYLSIASFHISGRRYFTGIIHDLTERKQAEEALARERTLLRTLIDNAPDSIYIKDDQCRFLMNNPAHLKLLGVAGQQEAEGKTDFDFFPHQLADRYHTDDRQVLTSGRPLLNREEPVVGADGRLRWMAASKIPLFGPDGRPTRLIGLSRDITELRDARERLEQINAELTQKNQEMEQFVYTVSHDLKSPIVTCVGFMGLMKEDIKAQQYDSLDDSMQRLERAISRMHQSINDLLELSRVGRVRSRPEQIDMDEMIGQIAEEMAPRLAERGIQLDVAGDLPPIIADRTRVVEVFENLITNAIKYGGDVAQPRIEIGSQEADDEVRFYVRDNGPGIAPEYHKRIFGLFQRLDNKKEGTGVGLTIVQRIMEVHGGRVWIESQVGQGATFWLAFPLAVVESEDRPVEQRG
jgi:PAS domain S-box-containing protein